MLFVTVVGLSVSVEYYLFSYNRTIVCICLRLSRLSGLKPFCHFAWELDGDLAYWSTIYSSGSYAVEQFIKREHWDWHTANNILSAVWFWFSVYRYRFAFFCVTISVYFWCNPCAWL